VIVVNSIQVEKEQHVSRICVVYHSGYGHTKAQADAVADGARSVPDTEVHQIPVQQIDAYWEQLHAADALIFGTPTYMGTVSAEFKAFMDKTSQFWANQPWKDKLAAAFTNSGSQHGDKLNTLISLTVFAAQHGHELDHAWPNAWTQFVEGQCRRPESVWGLSGRDGPVQRR
jgi:multimeric flavodoxin WrbA